MRIHVRKRNHGTGRLWLFTVTAVSIWAYETSPVLGIATTILFAVTGAHAARKAWKAL